MDTNVSDPRVSIGLPVYNGEQYLKQTLDALLAQTYGDFEIVISDNASTDRTEEICRCYASNDTRIRYYRSADNFGAAWNYNRVFDLSTGEYFKWSAADDICAATFLEKCTSVLDSRPDVALCFSRCQAIDAEQNVIKIYPSIGNVGSERAARRFSAMAVGPYPFIPVFGLVRREVLARTKLIGGFAGSDRPLIGELALRGHFYEIAEPLFLYRIHPQQSWGSRKTRHEQQAWYDPKRLNKITFPHWRLLFEHEHTIFRTPISLVERLHCQLVMARWIRYRWRYLVNNLVLRDS